jgi:hypothetical protein
MSEESSFEYKALESDLEKLAEQIRAGRDQEHPETRSERELIKEAIRAFPEIPGAPVPPPPSDDADVAGARDASREPLPDYAKDAPIETKLEIEYLCDVALRKGISAAMAESKKSPYFVQDAFHDTLAGKLYPELQKRGIVK